MPCGALLEICGFQTKGIRPPASNLPSAAAEGWHACGPGSIFTKSPVSGNWGVQKVYLRHIFGVGPAVPAGGAALGKDGHSAFGAYGCGKAQNFGRRWLPFFFSTGKNCGKE
jgi:hypothetical protein